MFNPKMARYSLVAENFPNNFYQTILSSIKDPVMLIDTGFRILWSNLPRYYGDLPGRICYEVFFKRSGFCQDCPVKTVFDSGNMCVVEKSFDFPQGLRKWGEIRAYPVWDQHGHITHALKIGFDITPKKLNDQRRIRYINTLEKTLEDLNRQAAAKPRETEHRQTIGMLTEREMEVLRLMTEGLSNTEISQILTISPHTVKSHVTHIFNKLAVNDRCQATAQAVRLRLI